MLIVTKMWNFNLHLKHFTTGSSYLTVGCGMI